MHQMPSPGAPQWAEGAGGAGVVGLNGSTRTARLSKAKRLPKVTELVATGAVVVAPKVIASFFYKNLNQLYLAISHILFF